MGGAVDKMAQTPANTAKLDQLRAILAEVLAQGLCRDFYGSLSLHLEIEDGTIQGISSAVSRKVR